jgi:hypothetical protein
MPTGAAGVPSMPKTRSDCSPKAEATRSGPPPLSAGIRRHLGLSLRTFYAEILSEPPGARIEALLARLGKPHP